MKLIEIKNTGKKFSDLKIDLNQENIDCSRNKLTSLEGAPQNVGGDFYCSNNNLTSLEGAPQHVGGYFYCSDNNLTSLEGAPQDVGANFGCSNNKLTSLEGAPQDVGGDFYCNYNNLTSLENIHLQIKHIGGNLYCDKNPIKSNVLGVLLIGCDPHSFQPIPGGKAPGYISLDKKQVEDILNKYLEKIHSKEMAPRKALLEAQNELQDANLDEYADL